MKWILTVITWILSGVFFIMVIIFALLYYRKKGFKTIVFGTGDETIKQLHLYQKEGCEIFDIKKNFFMDNYPEPIYENEILLNHMIMLKKEL